MIVDRIRLFRDRELTQPIGTVRLPMRTPSVLDISKITSITNEDVYVYDENHEVQVATVAHGCFNIQGLNLRTESVFEETSNLFPLGAFPPVQGETAADVIAAENENPRYFYTEGGTRFRIYYGETPTQIIFTITNAAMFTNGPYGPKPGGGNYPADAEGYQGIAPGRAYTHFVGRQDNTIASFLKSAYEETTFKVQFVRNAVRFPNDEDTREIIIAVASVAPTGHTYQEVPFEWYVKAYTEDVFNGVQGYIPEYAPTDNNVHRGGTGGGGYGGTGHPANDFSIYIATRNNDLSGLMNIGTGGLRYYLLSGGLFHKSIAFAYTDQGWRDSNSEMSARRDAYIGAFCLPVTPHTVTNSVFTLANQSKSITDWGVLSIPLVDRVFTSIEIGTISLADRGWDDFNDFSNTTASIYLPFVGRIDIDINAIARGNISLNAVIDNRNGNIAYYVLTNAMDDDRWILYGVYTGNCAIQVPTCGTYRGNVMDMILNQGTAIASGVMSVATKNPVGVASSVASIGMGVRDYFNDVHVNRGGGVDTASASITSLEPTLDLEWRRMLRAENSRSITGIPAYVTAKLNTLNGFVQVADVDVSGLTCEENEANAIRNLLKEGVYL